MGVLDSLTIVRYGHVYDSGGGMEQYLTDLNNILMARSRFRTIQVQLTSNAGKTEVEEECLGLGKMERVSLFVSQASHEQAVAGSAEQGRFSSQVKKWVRDRLLFAPGIYQYLTRPRLLGRRRVPSRPGEPQGAGETLHKIHRRHNVSLICLHSAGGADVSDILDVAEAQSIPVVYVHHFSNDRLLGMSMCSQLERMQGVSGVSGIKVPQYIRSKFRNVADGIDTEFFRRERARSTGSIANRPLIFLPARITPTKGQSELIRAAGELKRRGLVFRVALAGRTDDPGFLNELKQLIKQEGLANDVEFLGQLGPGKLRDWYAAASILAFPTRHHEGLPRTLLEAQSMGVPPVVYKIGGTEEGIQDGQTGYLVGLGRIQVFIRHLDELLQNEDLRRRMGSAGRIFIENNFSLSSLARRHEQFYTESLGAWAARSAREKHPLKP